jgi:hypothetical protein
MNLPTGQPDERRVIAEDIGESSKTLSKGFSWSPPFTKMKLMVRVEGVNPVAAQNARWFFWGIPFTIVIFKSPFKSHIAAFKQLALILLATFLPLLLAALAETAYGDAKTAKEFVRLYAHNLYNDVKLGEVFIYVATFCAPMGWIFYKFNSVGKSFPNLFSYLMLTVVIWSSSMLFFCFSKNHPPPVSALVNLLGVLLLFAIVLLAYLAMVSEANLDASPVDFEEVSNKSSKNTSEKLAHIREKP